VGKRVEVERGGGVEVRVTKWGEGGPGAFDRNVADDFSDHESDDDGY
jgi:hypothetical protein